MLMNLWTFVEKNCWAIIIDLVLTGLLFYPLYVFLVHSWPRRAAEIGNILGAPAKQRYLAIFHKQTVAAGLANVAFKKLYEDRYGRRHFAVPLLLLAIIALMGNYFVGKGIETLVAPAAKPSTFSIAAAALAGAYTFVCWDMFARMQRLTMFRVDILRAGLRLAVAMPIGFAFGSLMNESVAPFIAFAIGAFPLQIILVFLQRISKKKLDLEYEAKSARDNVYLLTGIDTTVAERLEDADVTTITQLAWADPVQLAMRTNLQFAFVLDIISQALAWVYLEGKLQPFGIVGLRGAVEIRTLLRDIGAITPDGQPRVEVLEMRREVAQGPRGTEEIETGIAMVTPGEPAEDGAQTANPDRDAAKAAVTAAAKVAELDEKALMYALLQIGKDPMAEFLELSWRSFME